MLVGGGAGLAARLPKLCAGRNGWFVHRPHGWVEAPHSGPEGLAHACEGMRGAELSGSCFWGRGAVPASSPWTSCPQREWLLDFPRPAVRGGFLWQ